MDNRTVKNRLEPTTAYGHTSRIAKPRLVGTLGELEVRKYIIDRLKDAGVAHKENFFDFYPTFPFDFLKKSILFITSLLLLQFLLFRVSVGAAALCALFTIVISAYLLSRWRFYEKNIHINHSESHRVLHRLNPSIGFKIRSANIEADTHTPPDPKCTVYLTAHYDSKSQNISLTLRIALSFILYFGIFILPFTIISAYFFPVLLYQIWFRAIVIIGYLVVIIAGLVLHLLNIENRSNGAVDNAASCGLLLAMNEAFSNLENKTSFQNIAVRTVFTGAEEVGLAGAQALVRQFKDKWRNENIVVINLDGIGIADKHSITSETGLFSDEGQISYPLITLVQQAAAKKGVPMMHLKGILGGEADHIPFVKDGFPAVSIGSYSINTRKIHTSQDNLRLVSLDALETTAGLLLEILESLDSRAD